MTDIQNILARIADLSADATIDKSLYSDMVTYGSVDKCEMGQIAYAIRTHNVAGVKGNTLTDYAERTHLARPSLSQWASMVEYLDISDTTVTATTFGHAMTVYNAPSDWKKANLKKAQTAIAALPQGKRAAQWANLARTVKALRTVAPVPAPSEPQTDAEPQTDTQTRAPQVPTGEDIGERTIAFVADLRSLAERAGKGDETFIAPDNAQAREIENLLDLIRSHVVEYVSA